MPADQYIAPPVETDPDPLAQESFDSLTALVPGWEPAEANLETMVLEETAAMAAEVRDVASQVPTTIFRYMGAALFGVPPIDSAPAYVTSTWTVTDTQGYTIPAETQLTISKTGTELYGFQVLTDVDIPPGATATQPGEVELQALISGIDANGLSGEIETVDSLPWVATITLQNADGSAATSSGGVDAELDQDYLDRLVGQLQLIAPGPVVADDFATLYKSVAGVERALALDGYNPADNSWTNEKMVTLVAVDESGNPASAAAKADGAALFATGGPYEREVNFIVNFADPTYTIVDVTVDVTIVANLQPAAVPGASGPTPAAVVEAVRSELTSYLDPSNWGKSYEREALDSLMLSKDWVLADHVYYLELTTLVNNVEGVARVTSLTFGVSGGALSGADLFLPGAAPLTRPGTITVTSS